MQSRSSELRRSYLVNRLCTVSSKAFVQEDGIGTSERELISIVCRDRLVGQPASPAGYGRVHPPDGTRLASDAYSPSGNSPYGTGPSLPA